jgi:cytochrome c biogenesis protein CcmG, thiol:disulfide interchange protein DsbE
VLVNFWASWCLPCRSEFPKIARERVANPGLAVIGVVFEDSASSARSFTERLNATWPSVFDKDGRVAAAWGVRRPLPRSFFIDSRGIIRRSVYGEMTQAELDRYAAEVTPKKT